MVDTRLVWCWLQTVNLAWLLSAAMEQTRYDSLLQGAESKLGAMLTV
eukprot:COSAG06_NODE_35758_length_456_cov_0.582633_2_plen_46_part_01